MFKKKNGAKKKGKKQSTAPPSPGNRPSTATSPSPGDNNINGTDPFVTVVELNQVSTRDPPDRPRAEFIPRGPQQPLKPPMGLRSVRGSPGGLDSPGGRGRTGNGVDIGPHHEIRPGDMGDYLGAGFNSGTMQNRKKIRISGTGVEGGDLVIHEIAGFDINTKGVGEGSVFVNVRDPSGENVPCLVELIGPGHHRCMYKPTTPGLHTVFVTFRAVNLFGSPFKVYVHATREGPSFMTGSSTPSPRSSVSPPSSRGAPSPKLREPNRFFPKSPSSPMLERAGHPSEDRRPSLPSTRPMGDDSEADKLNGNYVSMVNLPEEKPDLPPRAFDPKQILNSCALLKYISLKTKFGIMRCMPHVIDLEFGKLIGHGHFGSVYEARCTVMHKGARVIAVKCLTDPDGSHITNERLEEFLREPLIMSKFKHANVLELLGVTIHEGLPFIMMPIMNNGNLKTFLEKNKHKKLRQDFLLSFSHQVAKGMEYISSLKIVHRDLAARNCMLDDDLIIKIADFGLARDGLREEYIMMTREKFLPIRWIAPESEDTLIFNSTTDMWALGIVLWEIFTYGDWPYEGVPDTLVFQHLRKGNRLQKPKAASDDMYVLMLRCWESDPSKRPTFPEAAKILNHLLDDFIYKSIKDRTDPDTYMSPIHHARANKIVRFPNQP